MRNKILTHKVTRDGWCKGWYFKADDNAWIFADDGHKYKVVGAMYNSKNVSIYKCFLMVSDDTGFTVLGRI